MIPARHRGFTLIEIVLVVALISLVAGTGLRLPYLFAPHQVRDADVFSVVTSLYRAQTMAASGRGDVAWGVHVAVGEVTIFRGLSYDTRDTVFDEHIPLEASFTLSDATDVVFEQGTGLPIQSATISMQFDGEEAIITTSLPNGVIEYFNAQ